MAANLTTTPHAGSGAAAGGEAPAGEGGHYLTFQLGDGLFATDIRSVREIIQYGAMTTVPLMPSFVLMSGRATPSVPLSPQQRSLLSTLGPSSAVTVFIGSCSFMGLWQGS